MTGAAPRLGVAAGGNPSAPRHALTSRAGGLLSRRRVATLGAEVRVVKVVGGGMSPRAFIPGAPIVRCCARATL